MCGVRDLVGAAWDILIAMKAVGVFRSGSNAFTAVNGQQNGFRMHESAVLELYAGAGCAAPVFVLSNVRLSPSGPSPQWLSAARKACWTTNYRPSTPAVGPVASFDQILQATLSAEARMIFRKPA